MTAVANCSRRLLARSPSAAALALLPARPQAARPRPTSAAASLAAAASPFSTSSPALAKNNSHYRPGRNTQAVRNKKKQITFGKAIAPGERKAYRKRIVLSNNNALEVPGLQELTTAHLLGDLGNTPTPTSTSPPPPRGLAPYAAASAIPPPCDGRIVTLPDPLIDHLRAAQAFKPTQNFALFRRPSLLVRAETTQLISKIQTQVTENKGTLRVVVDGKRIAGKSTMLMQALSYGFLNDYLVFNIPEAQDLTDGGLDFTVVPNSDPVQYLQPTATLRFLHLFIEANSALLARLKTARAHDRLNNPVDAGSSLLELCQAAKEADNAWSVLQALWSELTDPAPVDPLDGAPLHRPPIMFAVDGLAHIMRFSAYRTPAFAKVHAHDLLLVRMFVDALGGATAFPHGAAILAATTRGNAPITPSVELALAQRLVEQANATLNADEEKEAPPVRQAYGKGFDDRVEASLKTVEVLRLSGVSKPEARSLMEYWAASGVVRSTITEQQVAAMWTLSSNGLVGELERAALLSIQPAYK